MKIIFLTDSNFSNREYERFGFYEMLNEKIEVRLIDFRKLRREQDISEESFEKDGHDLRIKRYIILSSSDLDKIAHEFFGAFVIDNRSGTYQQYTAFWLKGLGAHIVQLDQGLLPTSLWKPSIFDLIVMSKNTFLNYGLLSLITKIFWYSYNRFKINNLSNISSNHYDIKVCSGAISKCPSEKFEIRSHAFDYDIYLQQKNSNNIQDIGDYAVFLDSGIVDHPDSKRLSSTPAETDKTYYPALRLFFDDFENKMGIRVIIAIHPRILISKEIIKKFGNREVVLQNTSRLVKSSKMVIAHNSTSINFAVLWRIPLLIITTTLIDRVDYEITRSIECIFKTKRININKSYKDKDYTKISKSVMSQYDYYKENLIKIKNSPKDSSANILIKSLKKYV